MSPLEANPQDDRFSALLADYDEALAADESALPHAHPPGPHELLARLEPLEALLRRLDNDRRSDPALASGPADASATLDPESEPRQLGRFQLVRELGRGGYGVVFLAW